MLGLVKKTPKSVFALGLVLITSSSSAWAIDDDEEFFQNLSRSPSEYTLNRMYIGARDEQPLAVQDVLPRPLRSPAGTNLEAEDLGSD